MTKQDFKDAKKTFKKNAAELLETLDELANEHDTSKFFNHINGERTEKMQKLNN